MRILLIVLALFCFSCKIRQVAKTSSHLEKDSTRTVVKDSSGSGTTYTSDTSSKVITIKTVDKDSSETTTTILPDSGVTIVVNKDGSVSGHIKSIITHKVDHSSRTKEKREQQKSGKDSVSTHQSITKVLDSGHVHLIKDTTSKQIHSDSTVAANFPWWYAAILLVVITIIIIIVKRFKLL